MVMFVKIYFKVLMSVLLILAVVILPSKLYDPLNTDKITDEIFRRREKYFYGVINVWQIDCFEGGTGSRTNWLKNICGGFEKKNNGVYINVESVSIQMAKKLIESGQKLPDMISYGIGVGINEEQLEILEIETELPELSNVVYNTAIPWCMGAYFVIGDNDVSKWGNDGGVFETKKRNKIVYSIGIPERDGYDAYYPILKKCDNSFNGEYAILTQTSSELFAAYNYTFKVNRIIGTQRDLYRLHTAEERQLARAGDIICTGYSDLFQYISVFKCDNEKKVRTMNSFVDYLLDKRQQDKLGSIGMFPVRMDSEPQYSLTYVTEGWKEIQKNGIECKSYLFDADTAIQNKEEHLRKLQKKD